MVESVLFNIDKSFNCHAKKIYFKDLLIVSELFRNLFVSFNNNLQISFNIIEIHFKVFDMKTHLHLQK